MRSIALVVLVTCEAFGQSTETAPRFEIADVHASPKINGMMGRFGRFNAVRNGRYEVKNANLVELIANAWGFGDDKVLGGPSWLEMDRFDITAKIPPDASRETQTLMLQTLLAERFGLKVHKDTKPLPTYALAPAKKLQMKQGDGTGETGCKPESNSAAGGDGGGRLMMAGRGGAAPVTIALGPGGEVIFHCRNITMAAFAEELPSLPGARGNLGPNPILDHTGLEGRWSFDVTWSLAFFGPMINGGERVTLFDALEKQLGLKLEKIEIPTPVLMVDNANRKPSDNPPGIAEALPPFVPPTEFEVAEIKPSAPGAGRGGAFRFQPGGRVTAQSRSMSLLLMRAFGSTNNDELVGVPSWAGSVSFDLSAKAPSAGNPAATLDFDSFAPLLRSLLAERFGLKYHTENRQLTAYNLVAVKPKLKKADPASRTWCRQDNPPPGAPPGSQLFNCQNATIAEFAELLQNATQELKWPVLDATGIEGRWDLSLSFSQDFGGMMGGGGRGGAPGAPGDDLGPSSDPSGVITIFQAVEKQLGLRLEAQKRSLPVTVIDHLEQKPTDN